MRVKSPSYFGLVLGRFHKNSYSFALILQGQCQDLRKRKQLELQILSEPIQAWEGEDIKTLGNVIFMSQVMVQYGTCEVSCFKFQHHFFHLSHFSSFIFSSIKVKCLNIQTNCAPIFCPALLRAVRDRKKEHTMIPAFKEPQKNRLKQKRHVENKPKQSMPVCAISTVDSTEVQRMKRARRFYGDKT